MKRTKQVKLTERQTIDLVQKQVRANTNVFESKDTIKRILRSYFDVVYACVANEIRVPMFCTTLSRDEVDIRASELGEFYCYANRGRKEGVYRVPQTRNDGTGRKNYEDVIMTHLEATPPYGRIKVKISKRIQDDFKQRTLDAVHYEEPSYVGKSDAE